MCSVGGSLTITNMSGHSKWSKVKHKKAIEDARRAKIFSKLSKLISLAAKEKGGNPETNTSLKIAIEKAKSFNMPQDNIERAIKRGTGEDKGGKFEDLLLEAFGPKGISILIEAVTDNKKRTISEVRKIVESFGGKMASGGVLWHFEKKGVIVLKAESKEKKEELELLAIELGADDVKEKDDILEIYTVPEKLEDIKKELIKKEVIVESAALELVPKEEIQIKDQDIQEKIGQLFDALDENDDVQEIYSDVVESDSLQK